MSTHKTGEPSALNPALSRPDYVPANYSDLFDHYFDYVKLLVRQAGINPENIEDVAMSILTKFIENDVLQDFNPDYTSEYRGVTHTAVFRTFFSGFVRIYLRHYVHRQTVKVYREPVILNTPLKQGVGEAMGLEWIHLHTPTTEDTYEDLYTQDMLQTIRESLVDASDPAWLTCPLLELFDACIAQVRVTGRTSVQDLASTLGYSRHTIGNRMKSLQEVVTRMLSA